LVLRGALGFARWVASGPVPPVRVLTGWTDDVPPPDLEQWLPPATGPTCEVVLCPGKPDRLVFRCFHGVMDARGLLHFAEDVFRSLRGEPLVGSDCTLNDTEMVRSLSSQTRPMLKGERLAVTTTTTGPAKASAMIHQRLTIEKPANSLVARIAATLARHATQFHTTPTRVAPGAPNGAGEDEDDDFERAPQPTKNKDKILQKEKKKKKKNNEEALEVGASMNLAEEQEEEDV
jgi:hypothetical protein